MQNPDLLLENYDYSLPKELIASRPLEQRSESKLLVYHCQSGDVFHKKFSDLPGLLPDDSMLVLNQSKVFPARLKGHKASGGKCEVFLLSLRSQNGLYPVMIKTSGKKKQGDQFQLQDLCATLEKIEDDGTFMVRFNVSDSELLNMVDQIGEIPIPPYIRGGVSDEKDRTTYQTVYARHEGSVAAPTAGLHFTPELLKELEEKGVPAAYVTLHVGAGTFKTVSDADITKHKMHEELFTIEKKDLERLNQGRKRIAVGTTSLRVLESTVNEKGAIDFSGDFAPTDIFLYPSVQVKSIAGLITNFHLPKSSLIMLVSALIGREKTLELYQIAIDHKYRFFSYGDAMLIIR